MILNSFRILRQMQTMSFKWKQNSREIEKFCVIKWRKSLDLGFVEIPSNKLLRQWNLKKSQLVFDPSSFQSSPAKGMRRHELSIFHLPKYFILCKFSKSQKKRKNSSSVDPMPSRGKKFKQKRFRRERFLGSYKFIYSIM